MSIKFNKETQVFEIDLKAYDEFFNTYKTTTLAYESMLKCKEWQSKLKLNSSEEFQKKFDDVDYFLRFSVGQFALLFAEFERELSDYKDRNKENQDEKNWILFNLILEIWLAGIRFRKRQKDLKIAQLRITYVILYHTGVRINELREINQHQIEDAIKSSQITIIHHKTKQSHIHILTDTAIQRLKDLKDERDIVFKKYKYKYLFGKNKPVHKKTLIRIINQDLKHTCEINQIPFNIKSHSFRINTISSLLKETTVQEAAQIIGHKDIKSTMSYQRYALNKADIKKLLEISKFLN